MIDEEETMITAAMKHTETAEAARRHGRSEAEDCGLLLLPPLLPPPLWFLLCAADPASSPPSVLPDDISGGLSLRHTSTMACGHVFVVASAAVVYRRPRSAVVRRVRRCAPQRAGARRDAPTQHAFCRTRDTRGRTRGPDVADKPCRAS